MTMTTLANIHKTADILVVIHPVYPDQYGALETTLQIPIIDLEWNVRTLRELLSSAEALACCKFYGNKTFWKPEDGVKGYGYGQVMRKLENGTTEEVSNRAKMTSQIENLPGNYHALLQEQAAMRVQMKLDYSKGFDAARKGLPLPSDHDRWSEINRGYVIGNLIASLEPTYE